MSRSLFNEGPNVLQTDNILCIQLTRNCRGHSAAQGSHGCHCNLLVAVLVGARVSGGNHVGLEQGALQVHMVVGQSLVDGSKDLLSDVLAPLQVVVTIRENLRLDDGDDAVLRKKKSKMIMLIRKLWDLRDFCLTIWQMLA